MNNRQKRIQHKRDIKVMAATLVPLFRTMQDNLRDPEYTKEALIEDVNAMIIDLEKLK